MKLKEMLKDVECTVYGDENTEISSIEYDSRKTEKNSLFFCIEGFKTDGHLYAQKALEKGAVAFVVSRLLDLKGVTQVLVNDTREAMALIASNYFGRPAEKLTVVGVTLTNGKTSSFYMLKSVL